MPYKSKNTRANDGENHGSPAGQGQPKGTGDLPLGRELDRPDITDEFGQDDATDETSAPELRHPNRNLDKPQLDKPSYGGGH